MKLNFFMNVSWILSIAFMLTPLMAQADKMGPNGDKFYEAAAHFEGACRNKRECRAPYSRDILFSLDNKLEKIQPETRSSLKEVAHYQTQIWGDTILEGDYVAAGDLRLDEVVAYYHGSELLGYKIVYSETAWYTGDCSYDGSKDSLKSCSEGRIVEASYVSKDMETFFSDEEQFAQFLNLE